MASRMLTAHSGPTHVLKGNAAVAIGVDRHAVGCDNGATDASTALPEKKPLRRPRMTLFNNVYRNARKTIAGRTRSALSLLLGNDGSR